MSRVDEIKDRNNRTRTFSYDINDNLRIETWGGTAQLTYTYDKVSNLKTSYDAGSNTTNSYDYDEIYQLTDKTTGNTRFHYNYDVYGDITKREDWVNSSKIATLDYQYNKNHQLTYLKQTGSSVVAQDINLTYDRLNQLTQINRKSANDIGHLITDYQYDAVGLLADINNYFNTPTTGISNYHYGYDAGNRLILTTGTDGNSAVDYGNDNQLKAIDNTARPDEAYDFNQLGIRDSWSTVTGDSRQLFNDGTYEYQYDDEGNLSQKKELSTGNLTNYTWDYRNRLTKVTSGAQTVEYGYDAEDKRVSKKINGVTTEKYVYDGADIALVLDGAGTLVERYLYGDGVDNVLSRESAGAVVWSLGDKQGSVVDLVDEHGVVLNHFVYDGFGNQTGTTAVDFRYGYTGRELDSETGLYYYRARYYDPKVGRFISEDPIRFGAGDTNLYRYVGNNSTNYTDPSGNIPLLIGLAIGGAIAGGLFAGAYGVANHLESGGSVGNVDWGDIGQKASIGAFFGASFAVGGALLYPYLVSGLGALGVAESTVQAGGLFFGAAGTGWQAGVGAYNVTHGKPYTGTLDLIGAGLGTWGLHKGYQGYQQTLGREEASRWAALAAEIDNLPMPGSPAGSNGSGDNGGQIVPTTRSLAPATTPPGWINGNLVAPANKWLTAASLTPQDEHIIGNFERDATSPYGENIYNPLERGIGMPQIDALIADRKLSGSIMNLTDRVDLLSVRREAAVQLNSTSLNKPRRGNASFANVSINNQQSFVMRGFSTERNLPGFARYIEPKERNLITTYIDGRNGAQDPEAKMLEALLLSTNQYDFIRMRIVTERPVCVSCLDVFSQFLERRPNAKIEVVGSIIP